MKNNIKDLTVNNLSLNFGSNTIIDNISFELEKSEILALVGPSGSGKTSLIRCITGLEDPDKGQVIISDSTVFSDTINIPIEKRDIGIVFQDFALFPHMTVTENISYGIKNDKDSKTLSQISSLTDLMLMCGIYHLRDRYPDELSGG